MDPHYEESILDALDSARICLALLNLNNIHLNPVAHGSTCP